MRLIDALAAKKAVFNHNLSSRKEKAALLKLLDGLPEINPIHAAGGCYCQECKYGNEVPILGLLECTVCECLMQPEGFCHRGRRREGGE